jgi:hypothetical protein
MSNDLAGPQGLRPQDFESIRDAVMETPRGRWFLNEYAARVRSSETSGLLDNMRRLENTLSANHDALMARLADALKQESQPAPAQPQADLAPKHMKFFKQDEEIFEPAPQARIAAVEAQPRPETKPEPKPEVAKGARVVIKRTEQLSLEADLPAASVPEAKMPEPGEQPAAPAPAAATAAPESPPAPQPEAAAKRRIVIIRHKPGEDIDVPLQNEMAQAS